MYPYMNAHYHTHMYMYTYKYMHQYTLHAHITFLEPFAPQPRWYPPDTQVRTGTEVDEVMRQYHANFFLASHTFTINFLTKLSKDFEILLSAPRAHSLIGEPHLGPHSGCTVCNIININGRHPPTAHVQSLRKKRLKVQSSSSWSYSLTSLLETDPDTEVSHHYLCLLLLCSVG